MDDARMPFRALSFTIDLYPFDVVFSVTETSNGIKDNDHKLLQIFWGDVIRAGCAGGAVVAGWSEGRESLWNCG
jgi:hypothetical protein